MKLNFTLSRLLVIGLFGALITGIGEWLLHFSLNGINDEIKMVEHVPLARASVGHFLVVFGAPLYFAGYYAIMRMFQKGHETIARVFFIAGVFSFAVGGVWVASRYMIALVLQTSAGTADYMVYLSGYEQHYQSLVWALRVLILVVSGLYILLVLRNQSGFPRWLALLNPITILLAVFLLFFLAPSVGIYVVPTAMNVTHLIFFGVILIQFRSLNERKHEMD